MARTKTKRRYIRKKNKYNIETNPGIIADTAWLSPTVDEAFNLTYNQVVVPPSTVEGVRKVKNLTISVAYGSVAGSNEVTKNPIFWALVYVPEGTQPNYLNDVGDLYQPSQWVLSSGILNIYEGKSRIYTPLAKNLNKGDRICLCLGTESQNGPSISYLVRYAICFN